MRMIHREAKSKRNRGTDGPHNQVTFRAYTQMGHPSTPFGTCGMRNFYRYLAPRVWGNTQAHTPAFARRANRAEARDVNPGSASGRQPGYQWRRTDRQIHSSKAGTVITPWSGPGLALKGEY